jgi:tetratricopeptide (TPR) repeat protein
MVKMNLWKQVLWIRKIRQATKYKDKAATTENSDRAIKLYDKAISLWQQVVEQDEIEMLKIIHTGNLRNSEANRCTVFASKFFDAEISLSGRERVDCLKKAAECSLAASSIRMEVAEITREYGDPATYYNILSLVYLDGAFHQYYLAWAADAVGDLDDALSNYRKALSTLKTALEHVDKSLQMKPSRDIEEGRKHCLEYVEWCRSGIREVEFKMRSGGVKKKRTRRKRKQITETDR